MSTRGAAQDAPPGRLATRAVTAEFCGYDDSEASWALQATGAAASPWTGQGVRVAVLDTGAALNHPHLASRIRAAISFVEGESAEDGNGHGTQCCGVVCGPRGASGHVAYGVAPNVELYVAKVLSDAHRTGSFQQMMYGLEWALQQECRVVCLALGMCHLADDTYGPFEELARAALERGTLLVAASGNTSNRFGDIVEPVQYPASSESVLAVSAVTTRLTIDLNSNAGASRRECGVAVAAPGQAILTARRNGGIGYVNGTSIAAGVVAGIAALWLDAVPRLGGRELWDVLTSTAQPLGGELQSDVGAGLVQAPQTWHGITGRR